MDKFPDEVCIIRLLYYPGFLFGTWCLYICHYVHFQIFFEIFSLLDLAAIRKVREVSKKWKFLVPYIRPNLHFVCHITDDTFKYAVNSEEEFVRLEVHDFSGKGNEVVSSTNGTGLLFGNAEYIIFTGNNIEPGEIPKMMQFAVDSVETLEFQNCEIDTLRPFIDAKQSFHALKKLSVCTMYK